MSLCERPTLNLSAIAAVARIARYAPQATALHRVRGFNGGKAFVSTTASTL
jgi:hypothetical protein